MWSIDRTDDGRTCTCDLRGLSFCRAAWYFGNASATDGCFYQATAARRCRIKMLTSRSSPLMCRPRAYGRVLACPRVPVTTKESIRLPDNINNRVRRAVWLERSWLAWFNRQTNTALISVLSKVTHRAHIMLSGCRAFCQRRSVIPQGTHVASGVPIDDHIYPFLPIPWCFTCKTSSSSFAYLTPAPLYREGLSAEKSVKMGHRFWVYFLSQSESTGKQTRAKG